MSPTIGYCHGVRDLGFCAFIEVADCQASATLNTTCPSKCNACPATFAPTTSPTGFPTSSTPTSNPTSGAPTTSPTAYFSKFQCDATTGVVIGGPTTDSCNEQVQLLLTILSQCVEGLDAGLECTPVLQGGRRNRRASDSGGGTDSSSGGGTDSSSGGGTESSSGGGGGTFSGSGGGTESTSGGGGTESGSGGVTGSSSGGDTDSSSGGGTDSSSGGGTDSSSGGGTDSSSGGGTDSSSDSGSGGSSSGGDTASPTTVAPTTAAPSLSPTTGAPTTSAPSSAPTQHTIVALTSWARSTATGSCSATATAMSALISEFRFDDEFVMSTRLQSNYVQCNADRQLRTTNCNATVRILNEALDRFVNGTFRACDFTTVSTTASTTAETTATSTATSTAVSTATTSMSTTATTSVSSTATTTGSSTASTTAETTPTTTVTTQFTALSPYGCRPSEDNALVSALTVPQGHCDRSIGLMNLLLQWCDNGREPDLDYIPDAGILRGVTGRFECDADRFLTTGQAICPRHAEYISHILARSHGVKTPVTCGSGNLEVVGPPGTCETVVGALNDMITLYTEDPFADPVRGCSSFPYIFPTLQPDFASSYRFVIIKDEQYNAFLSSGLSTDGLLRALRLELGNALNIPVNRIAPIVNMTDRNVVTVSFLPRDSIGGARFGRAVAAAEDGPTTNELLMSVDSMAAASWTFTYSRRTLTIRPIAADGQDDLPLSSTASDDSGIGVVGMALLLVLLLVAAILGVFIYRRQTHTPKSSPVINLAGVGADTDTDFQLVANALTAAGTDQEAVAPWEDGITINPEALRDSDTGRYNYVVPELSSSDSAFTTSELGTRPTAVQNAEYSAIQEKTVMLNKPKGECTILDDYDKQGGLVASTTQDGSIPWDIIWERDCRVVILLPPKAGTKTQIAAEGQTVSDGETDATTQSVDRGEKGVIEYEVHLENKLEEGAEKLIYVVQLGSWGKGTTVSDFVSLLQEGRSQHIDHPEKPVFVHDVKDDGEWPSLGAYVLAWIAVKSSLHTGHIDLARTLTLLRAQKKDLVKNIHEYHLVNMALKRILVSSPTMGLQKLVRSQRGNSLRRSSKSSMTAWHPAEKEPNQPEQVFFDAGGPVPAPGGEGGSANWRRFSVTSDAGTSLRGKADFSHLLKVQTSIHANNSGAATSTIQAPETEEDAESGYVALVPLDPEVEEIFQNLLAYYAKHAPAEKSDEELHGVASRVAKSSSGRINGPMYKKYGESFDEFCENMKAHKDAAAAAAKAEAEETNSGKFGFEDSALDAPPIDAGDTSESESDDEYDVPKVKGPIVDAGDSEPAYVTDLSRRMTAATVAKADTQPLYVNDAGAGAFRTCTEADDVAATSEALASLKVASTTSSSASSPEGGYRDIYPAKVESNPHAAVEAAAAEPKDVSKATTKFQERFKKMQAKFI